MSRPPSRASSRANGLPSSPSPRRSNSATRLETPQMPVLSRHRTVASEHLPPGIPPVPSLAVPEHLLRHSRSANSLPSRPVLSRARSIDRSRTPRAQEPPPPLPIPRVGLAAVTAPPSSYAFVEAEPHGARGGRTPTVSPRPSVSPRSSSGSSSAFSSFSQDRSSGYATSATSLTDGPSYVEKSEPYEETEETSPEPVEPGHGTSLWERVTDAGNVLTVNVSKALYGVTDGGQETPVGQESRLTQAMKTYHINKARTPSDLPEWLFDERDRGVIGGLQIANPDTVEETTRGRAETRPAVEARGLPRGPGLHRLPTMSRSASRTNTRPPEAGPSTSIPRRPTHAGKDSIARLQELRAAKRNAKVRFDDGVEDADTPRIPPPRHMSPPPDPYPTAEPVSVGSASPPPGVSRDPAPWISDPPRKAPTPPVSTSASTAASTPARKGFMRFGLPSAVRLRGL